MRFILRRPRFGGLLGLSVKAFLSLLEHLAYGRKKATRSPETVANYPNAATLHAGRQ